MARISVDIPDDLLDDLEDLAAVESTTVKRLVRRVLEDVVAEDEHEED